MAYFWGQNYVICQNLGKAVKLFFPLKFIKNISVRFMDRNLVKNVIKGVNLVKIGHFLVKTVKIGSFWGPKWRHMSKFREIGQIIFSLKVSNNYSSHVYSHKFGENSHYWGQFGQIGHFRWKYPKFPHFWG